jgi:hypothetical protein
MSSSSPAVTTVASRQQLTISPSLALGISPTAWLLTIGLPVVLRPVNGTTVSLVGRQSHDYYHDSVTLGLAPVRPSRVPSLRNVLVQLGLPTHALG